DRPFFQIGHVGALFRLFTPGQGAQFTLGGSNVFTPPIRVTGVDSTQFPRARGFAWRVGCGGGGTVSAQMTFDTPPDTGWTDAGQSTGLAGASQNVDDGLNNVIVWYRFGFKSGDYQGHAAPVAIGPYTGASVGSATPATSTQVAAGGGRWGICR